MARLPFDTGVKVVQATVSPGADAAHYHYQALCAKRSNWAEIPFGVELEISAGDTAEAQENALVGAVNEIAGDL